MWQRAGSLINSSATRAANINFDVKSVLQCRFRSLRGTGLGQLQGFIRLQGMQWEGGFKNLATQVLIHRRNQGFLQQVVHAKNDETSQSKISISIILFRHNPAQGLYKRSWYAGKNSVAPRISMIDTFQTPTPIALAKQ